MARHSSNCVCLSVCVRAGVFRLPLWKRHFWWILWCAISPVSLAPSERFGGINRRCQRWEGPWARHDDTGRRFAGCRLATGGTFQQKGSGQSWWLAASQETHGWITARLRTRSVAPENRGWYTVSCITCTSRCTDRHEKRVQIRSQRCYSVSVWSTKRKLNRSFLDVAFSPQVRANHVMPVRPCMEPCLRQALLFIQKSWWFSGSHTT